MLSKPLLVWSSRLNYHCLLLKLKSLITYRDIVGNEHECADEMLTVTNFQLSNL